ncbi:MAG: hypothetical protein LBK26_02200 [Rickettsiales bacterium]|jgi:hypothetical protein|nr:hypothetical protein [Rickettsiales bacterium]
MGKIVRGCVGAVALVFCIHYAKAEDFANVHGGGSHNLSENSTVYKGAIVEFQNLYITDSLVLKNFGTISSDVIIDSGRHLTMLNAGKVSGAVNVLDNASLTQIVRGPDDLNAISVSRSVPSTEFAVMADNAHGVDFMDLANLAENSDKLILKDSLINFNLGDTAVVPILISGNVVFSIDDVSGLNEHVLLSNVLVEGKLFVSANVPNMFYTQTLYQNGDVILHVARDTDYEKIIGGDVGRFINNIRAAGANGRLIARMDAAQNVAELNTVMENSVMLNPVKLMNPVKIMARFADPFSAASSGMGGVSVIFGSGMSLYLGNAGAEYSAGDFSFGASAHFGQLDESGLEEFSGKVYGASVHAAMHGKTLYAEASIGVTLAEFETGPIYDGGSGTIYNPNGAAYYGAAAIGVNAFSAGDEKDFKVFAMPIARVRVFYANVGVTSESEFAPGAGIRIGRADTIHGIRTEYSAYGIWEQGGGQLGIRADIMSNMDGVGVVLDISALQTESVWYYKAGAGIRVLF